LSSNPSDIAHHIDSYFSVKFVLCLITHSPTRLVNLVCWRLI